MRTHKRKKKQQKPSTKGHSGNEKEFSFIFSPSLEGSG